MTHASSLVSDDWSVIVERLGGAAALEVSARASGAFIRPRKITCAVDLLRFTLAYCLSEMGLRLTAAWGSAVGLADLSNVALLGRLRNMGEWLTRLVGEALAAERPAAAAGRLIRVVDASTVPQAGRKTTGYQPLWRVHSVLDLPQERFSYLELTDGHGGERFDRAPVVKGEIRLGDRAYAQPDRIAAVIEAGGDVLVRTGWNNLRWLDADGAPLDLFAALRAAAAHGVLDRPVLVSRGKTMPPLPLRLIALAKPPEATDAARQTARKAASKGGHQITKQTLEAAGWVILVTSLGTEFSTDDIAALYRLRWRIELAFKRLKSLIGLKGPPAKDPRLAEAYVLAHLLIALLIEPHLGALDDSPRRAAA